MKLGYKIASGVLACISFTTAAAPSLSYENGPIVPFANYSTQSASPADLGDLKPFIIGGTNAEPDKYNFHVRLVQKIGQVGFSDICGASVLNDSFILTAAHCVMDYNTGDMTLDTDTGGIIVKNFSQNVFSREIKKIKAIHVHPLFPTDQYFIGDIAVIELEHPITDNIRSMPVATMTDKTDYDTVPLGEIIGLGYTDDNFSTPDFLQKNSAQLKTHSECETIIGSAVNYDEVICIKGEERTCQGDSGGSLLYYKPNGDLLQIGVTSYGYFQCEADSFSVFTEIAYYQSWIESLVTHGNELTFNPNGTHNGYHSFGDDNFVYSDTETDLETTTSGGTGGSIGITALFGLVGLGLRQKPVSSAFQSKRGIEWPVFRKYWPFL